MSDGRHREIFPKRMLAGIDIFGQPIASDDLRRLLSNVYSRARRRANAKGWPCDLDRYFVSELFHRQNGRCAVTGYGFTFEPYLDALVKFPYSPSIDRIDPAGGYTKNNVRLVCVAVNFGMGQWGDKVFHTLAQAAVSYRTQSGSVTSILSSPEAEPGDKLSGNRADRKSPIIPPSVATKPGCF
jgi:hypothetical protein